MKEVKIKDPIYGIKVTFNKAIDEALEEAIELTVDDDVLYPNVTILFAVILRINDNHQRIINCFK